MNPTEVLIKNWQESNHFSDYSTIAIAVIALGVSLYSAYLTRKSFVMANRPFVWASSYGVVDSVNHRIIPIASRIGCRIKNAPARILNMEIEILFNKNKLFSYSEKNIVRFPDDTSEWGHGIGDSHFKSILMQANTDITKLERSISFTYSALSGGKKYNFVLKQSYIPADGQWTDTFSKAD